MRAVLHVITVHICQTGSIFFHRYITSVWSYASSKLSLCVDVLAMTIAIWNLLLVPFAIVFLREDVRNSSNATATGGSADDSYSNILSSEDNPKAVLFQLDFVLDVVYFLLCLARLNVSVMDGRVEVVTR